MNTCTDACPKDRSHVHPQPRPFLEAGEARCRCGTWVKLIAESMGEIPPEFGGGEDWGPATAEHCGLLIAETDYEGTVEAFDLSAEKEDR